MSKVTTEMGRRILEMRSEGKSYRAIGAELDLSHVAVRAWTQRHGDDTPDAVTADITSLPDRLRAVACREAARTLEAQPEDEPEAPLPEEPTELLRSLIAEARGRAVRAEKAGNIAVVGRHSRDIAALSTVLARLEDREAARAIGPDTVVFTRAEIERARAELRRRDREALARPLLCTLCSRELSLDWAGVDASVLDGESST